MQWNRLERPRCNRRHRRQILTDIQNCQLANVTWVIPDGAASDHTEINSGLGPSWVASIVNTIGTNPACPGSNEVVLERHGDHCHLGRLGRLVRPRGASDPEHQPAPQLE